MLTVIAVIRWVCTCVSESNQQRRVTDTETGMSENPQAAEQVYM
jgi:hypothetical protein